MLKAPNRRPTLPGEILYEHFLKMRKITIVDFSSAIDCSRKHLSNIIHGRARIEAELATRISEALETTPQFWLNLQNAVDLWDAKQKIKDWHPSRIFPAIAAITAS